MSDPANVRHSLDMSAVVPPTKPPRGVKHPKETVSNDGFSVIQHVQLSGIMF